MFRIAVCDDDKRERDEVIRIAEAFFGVRGTGAEIVPFEDADGLLASGKGFDLYLLDVLLPGQDGIRTAEILRERDPGAVIVFITSMIDSAVDSYRVEAAGFLLKPVTPETFSETMGRLIRNGRIGREASLHIIYSHMPVDIPLRRVVVLESELHRVHIRLDGEIYSVSMRLNSLEEKLADHGEFLRCHQSFIVNLGYVSHIDGNEFVLRRRTGAGLGTVPISRNYLKRSKKVFYDFRLKGGSVSGV